MIEIHNISQSYNGMQVLRNVNLTIQEGKITALIGANGAGKSTLFNVATNLIEADEGHIQIDGQNIKKMGTIQLAQKISILKQTQNLNLRITVKELISFGRYPYSKGRLKPEDEEKIEQSIAYMNLKEIESKFIDEISGGQRQRAYIAMILAQDTKYIFLDEPLNNLDIRYSVEMMLILQKLVSELDKTVIIVLHDINFAASFADSIVAMKNGEIVKEGTPNEVVDKQILNELFDHDFHIVDVGGKKVCVYFQPDATTAKS